MIIQISAANSSKSISWKSYVYNGTKSKPRDPNCVFTLRGDADIGEQIITASEWTENSYHIILSFKGKQKKETLIKALDDFERNFMMGFSEDEYHLDAVLHTDTDDDHIHVSIPKMNLKTQTQLRLYYDKKDRNRINLIRDYIDLKYGFESPNDNLKLQRSNISEIIDYWRGVETREGFGFKNKKNREASQKLIMQEIEYLQGMGAISSLNDVTEWFKEHNVEVLKYGYDKPSDFYYVTIENDTGKMRVKSQIFTEDFWKREQETRTRLLKDNKNLSKKKSTLEEIVKELKKANERRIEEVAKRYNKARGEANLEEVILERQQDEYFDELKDRPFKFKNKKNREASQKLIMQEIEYLQGMGAISSLNDLTEWFKEHNVEVLKYGYDKPSDFYYVTIENDTGKMRVKSQIFTEDFWEMEKIEYDKDNRRVTERERAAKADFDRRERAILENLDRHAKLLDGSIRKAERKLQTRITKAYQGIRKTRKYNERLKRLIQKTEDTEDFYRP